MIEVLVFNTRGTTSYLHAEDCTMLRRYKPYKITRGAEVAPTVADLRGRGYKVVRCKCLEAA